MPREILDTKTFLLTVSVPGHLSRDTVGMIEQWVRKRTLHAYVVVERGSTDREHLHAVLVFKDPMLACKIRENVWDRYVKKFHPDAIGRRAVLCTVQYDHSWYDEYLKKETGARVIVDTYDREKITDFFPTKEVQEELVSRAAKRHAGDPGMLEHLERWKTFTEDSTKESALRYFKTRMYIERDMMIITDKKRLVDKALALYEFRNGIVEPSASEKRRMTEYDTEYSFAP